MTLQPITSGPLLFSSMLQGLVDFDGFYLESDPCLVCNNPEVPFSVSITRLTYDGQSTIYSSV